MVAKKKQIKINTAGKRVSKGVLKAKMLEYLREVERTGEELIVTDNNIPVLKIIPIQNKVKSTASVFKEYRNKVVYKEDINTPTDEYWSES